MSFNHTTNSDCPCKGCVPPTRTIGCHSSCQPYIDWDVVNKQKLDKRRKNREIDDVCNDGTLRRNKQLNQRGVKFGRHKNRNGAG